MGLVFCSEICDFKKPPNKRCFGRDFPHIVVFNWLDQVFLYMFSLFLNQANSHLTTLFMANKGSHSTKVLLFWEVAYRNSVAGGWGGWGEDCDFNYTEYTPLLRVKFNSAKRHNCFKCQFYIVVHICVCFDRQKIVKHFAGSVLLPHIIFHFPSFSREPLAFVNYGGTFIFFK